MKKIICKAQQDCTTMWLLALVCFLLGIIIGFVCSPIKSGMTIASNNIISNSSDDDDDEY